MTQIKSKLKQSYIRYFQTLVTKGTEDEFYENFFPDLDRSEQILVTKSGSDEALKTTGLDFTDPFAAYGTDPKASLTKMKKNQRERESRRRQ